MLQVTFRNLLPSEELVSAANDAYLALRARTGGGSRVRCDVTISADKPAPDGASWICVQVDLLQDQRALRVLAEGGDASRVVRSGLAALRGVPAHAPAARPSAELVAAAS